MALAKLLRVDSTAFRALMRETFDARSVGGFGDAGTTLIRLCEMLGTSLDRDTLHAALELRLAIERRLATPRAESISVLRALRQRGISIGLISDCGPETPAIWATHPLAEMIARPVFSCDAGFRKPHVDLYRSAAMGLGLGPEDCIYVGDGGSRELTGARTAGMHAVRLSVPGEEWGAELRFDVEDDWSGSSVDCLSAILSIAELASDGRETTNDEGRSAVPHRT